MPRIAPTERLTPGRAAAARRGARPHGPLHGRRGRPRRPVLHRRRPGALRADDAQRRRTGRRAPLQPADRRKSSPSRRARPISPSCAGSAGTSIRRYSGNRGELFPIGSYGHTGFTGTSIWIDPASQDLRDPAGQQRASRSRGPRSRRCAAKVATIAAAAVGITDAAASRSPATTRPSPAPACTARWSATADAKTGLDVLVDEKFQPFAGQAHRPHHQPDRRRPHWAAAMST